jgi:hypothetical protein
MLATAARPEQSHPGRPPSAGTDLALEDALGLLDAESARIAKATGSLVSKSEMVRAMFRAFVVDSRLNFGNRGSETDIRNVMGRYLGVRHRSEARTCGIRERRRAPPPV